MIKVALTGNIASGKSEVEKILKNQGYRVLCADEVSHRLLENDENVKEAVLKEFKTLERKKLGEIVFKDFARKKKLEEILHPKVREEIEKFFKDGEGEKLLFVSAALLYEAGMENIFDKVILVCADEKTRLERILKRNGRSREYASAQIASQMKEQKKRALADIVIENEGDLATLEASTKEALKLLL